MTQDHLRNRRSLVRILSGALFHPGSRNRPGPRRGYPVIMVGDEPYVPQLPELRELALAIESFGASAEILDKSFRVVFISTETVKVLDVTPEEANRLYGLSIIRRDADGSDVDVMRASKESGAAWFRHNAPIMRHYLEPGDPEFAEVFGPAAELAEQTDPIGVAPRAWHDRVSFPSDLRFRRFMLGDSNQMQVRLNDDEGRFLGILWQQRGALPESLMALLGRGDERLFERMSRVSEPARRPAAILFADLEASGALSRRLPSRGYFELIRDLTDLIDSSVVDLDGIVGKHAGDGGSALFLAADFDAGESAAARAAIEAAREIRNGAANLGPDDVTVKLNVGVHWGATLMVGQVATRGRLEVTALGDQMNEGARIEAAAKDGAILASKDLIERLDSADAEATGLDLDALAYTPLGELDGASDKAIRDAGAIPVTAI
jgi:class 3 adenylate cyclase